MGHAHHFLSRLDRVALPHVEIALDLYNDVPLLRYILDRAHVPEGAARVAISLDHPEEGPFLIVTRDGHFVTCLGAGMSPGEHPIITRGQLDGIAAKAAVLRERMSAAERMAGPTGGAGKLLRRVHDAGDGLSREEITAISGIQPLYAFELFRCLFAAGVDLVETREILLRQLRRTDKLRPHFRDVLRSYWNTLWSVGHFAVLAALDGWATFARWPDKLRDLVQAGPISWSPVREGIASLALKGLWAVGRIGKPLLPLYKQQYRDAKTPFTFINGAAGLSMIGLRHAKHYAEVVKVLRAGLDLEEGLTTRELLHALNDALLTVIDPAEGAPTDVIALQRAIGARRWIELTRHLAPGAPYRFEREGDVPEDLALCVAANDPFEYLGRTSPAILVFAMLPWVARASPEQLYLPREALRVCSVPWQPEDALWHLRSHRDYYLYKPPNGRPEGPARKGPCPCGSGKKYKRCCGAEAEGKEP